MIKIGFVIDTIACDTAGTQRQLIEVLSRLDSKRFEPCLICLWESDWMQQNHLPCEVRVLGYRGFIKPNFTLMMNRFVALLDERRFKIVQTFFEDSIFVTYLATRIAQHKPALLSSRRDMGLGTGQPWYHVFFRCALPFVNIGFDGVLTNSQRLKEHIAAREKVRRDKIHVIHNGIDIDMAKKHCQYSTQTIDEVVIGLVASLTPVKRVDVFLHSLALLKDRNPDLGFRAIICGDGPEKPRLVALTAQLGLGTEVLFAGEVREVASYLQLFDVGVLCSDREGLSNAILEYMAFSLPVVATAVGGNTELVDEENGFCVEPGNAKAIAKALYELCAKPDLRVRLGKGSFVKLSRSFSWERSMSLLESYYFKVAEAKSLYT